jgi:cellulose synthase/poly-beta-1,6-N-acetylglucosamine synthase-like glycosyltransferase
MLTFLNYTLIVFSLLYSIYILWQIISWLMAPSHSLIAQDLHTNVSIIIPCRNEEKNIGNCLQAILQQDYSSSLMEIIVADDHSGDNTKEVAERILLNSSYSWKYVKIDDSFSNKKKAIEAAISQSSGELILVTDADCITTEKWISTIVSIYEEHHYQMICGPLSLVNEDTICDKYQGLEVAGLSILAGAGIFSNNPLLCNGANIAYTRKAFDSVGGFKNIDSTPSGDDTLLLFKMRKQFPKEIGFAKNKNAIVYTQAQPNWHQFIQQRIRWASKGFASRNSLNSLVSLLVFVTNFLLFMYILGSLVYFSINWVFISCLFLKFTIDFLLLTCATEFFDKRRLLLHFLTGEFITIVYVSWVGLTASFIGYSWKGRDY